jgi:hypothetical protein
MLLSSIEQQFERKRRGVGPRCSFCGTTEGPFLKVEGLFTLLMCAGCQAARSSSNRGQPDTRVEMHDPDQPTELLAHHDPGQPWLHWGCALCEYRAIEPEALERHTAAQHPGWVARYEIIQPYSHQQLRVVYR